MAESTVMDMDKRLDMSLDEVIKQNAKQTAGRGAAKGNAAPGSKNKGKRIDQGNSARREQSRARSLAAKQGGISAKRKHPLVLDHAKPRRQPQQQQQRGQSQPQQTVTIRRGAGQRRAAVTGPLNLQVTIRNQQAPPPARSLPMPTGYLVGPAAQSSQPAYGRQSAQLAYGRQSAQPAYGRQSMRAPSAAVQQVNAMVQQRQQPAATMYEAAVPAAASYLRDDAQRGDVYTADLYNTTANSMRMDQYQAAFARARGQQVYAGQ